MCQRDESDALGINSGNLLNRYEKEEKKVEVSFQGVAKELLRIRSKVEEAGRWQKLPENISRGGDRVPGTAALGQAHG